MRRSVRVSVVLVLLLTLLVPGVALAKKGGVPASANGKGNAPVAAEPAEVADDGVEPAPVEEEPEVAPVVPSGKAKAKDKAKAKGTSEEFVPGTGEPQQDRDQDRDQERSQEGSGTPQGQRHGIENALTKLQDNLARMQAELEAGTRTNLPPGLQRVIAKFLSWLGIVPDDGGDIPDDGDEPGDSDETSGTVEPGDSDETSDTVEPGDETSDTVEPDGDLGV